MNINKVEENNFSPQRGSIRAVSRSCQRRLLENCHQGDGGTKKAILPKAVNDAVEACDFFSVYSNPVGKRPAYLDSRYRVEEQKTFESVPSRQANRGELFQQRQRPLLQQINQPQTSIFSGQTPLYSFENDQSKLLDRFSPNRQLFHQSVKAQTPSKYSNLSFKCQQKMNRSGFNFSKKQTKGGKAARSIATAFVKNKGQKNGASSFEGNGERCMESAFDQSNNTERETPPPYSAIHKNQEPYQSHNVNISDFIKQQGRKNTDTVSIKTQSILKNRFKEIEGNQQRLLQDIQEPYSELVDKRFVRDIVTQKGESPIKLEAMYKEGHNLRRVNSKATRFQVRGPDEAPTSVYSVVNRDELGRPRRKTTRDGSNKSRPVDLDTVHGADSTCQLPDGPREKASNLDWFNSRSEVEVNRNLVDTELFIQSENFDSDHFNVLSQNNQIIFSSQDIQSGTKTYTIQGIKEHKNRRHHKKILQQSRNKKIIEGTNRHAEMQQPNFDSVSFSISSNHNIWHKEQNRRIQIYNKSKDKNSVTEKQYSSDVYGRPSHQYEERGQNRNPVAMNSRRTTYLVSQDQFESAMKQNPSHLNGYYPSPGFNIIQSLNSSCSLINNKNSRKLAPGRRDVISKNPSVPTDPKILQNPHGMRLRKDVPNILSKRRNTTSTGQKMTNLIPTQNSTNSNTVAVHKLYKNQQGRQKVSGFEGMLGQVSAQAMGECFRL